MGRQADTEAVPELSDPGHGPEEVGPYASAQLAPHPAAPAFARQLTRDCLTRWDMRALTDDAVAIASELVANALAVVPPPAPA